MSSNKLIKSSIGVSIALVLGYLLSFLKESVVAYFYGISADADAYTIAIQIPVLLFSFVSVALNSVIIPLYSKLYYQENENIANVFVNKLLSLLLVFLLIFVSAGEGCADWIIKLFAPGFNEDTHVTAVYLLRIVFPSILFSVIANVYLAVLNVHKRFVAPSFAVYFLNIGLIGGILVLNQHFGIASACIGQLIGGGLQIVYLILLSRKVYGYHFTSHFLRDSNINTALKQIWPIVWSISVAEINALVNRMVASFLFVGSVASLAYANKLNSVCMSFFTHIIATIMYPLYAESAAKNDGEQLSRRVNLTITIYSMILIPLTAGILCLRDEIVQLAFGRGQFDSTAINVTAQLLGFYCLGILFLGFRETITKVFYSIGNTKTPSINATIGIILNIILNVTLPFAIGVNGLALATSISAAFISIGLLILLNRTRKVQLRYFFLNLWKMLIAAIFMSFIIFTVHHILLSYNYIIRIAVVTSVGIVIYILSLMVIDTPIISYMISIIKNKSKITVQ